MKLNTISSKTRTKAVMTSLQPIRFMMFSEHTSPVGLLFLLGETRILYNLLQI